MSLEDGEAWDNLVDRSASQLPLYDLVQPGSPQGSYLLYKLAGTHNDVGGMGLQMPKGKDPLSDEVQARISLWIAQGALP